jgi:hypothetical protein
MDDDVTNDIDSASRRRVVNRLDQLVASGRITEGEAARLRVTMDSGEFDDVVRAIRVRHARTELGGAVAEGRVSEQEADELFERLRNGEHPRSLRSRLHGLRAGRRTSSAAPSAPCRPEAPGQGSSA